MDVVEPDSLSVLSSSVYEHILFKCPQGRLFLVLTHESGLVPVSEAVVLTEEEKVKLEKNMAGFIDKLRATFCHTSRTFTFHNGERLVPQFNSWPACKAALDRWYKSDQE